MKYFASLLFLFFYFTANCQRANFKVNNISLPPEISYYDNQFSGLYIYEGKLLLLSESRLQDSAEAKLYAIALSDLNKKLTDTSYTLPFTKYLIYNAEILREKMKKRGDDYEGLEAMVILGNDIYFTVETATPSDNCYLLAGKLNDTAVFMSDELITLPKPVAKDSKHIYNAGFEGLAARDKNFFAFFEYNFFDDDNFVHSVKIRGGSSNTSTSFFFVKKLPFRITDITRLGKKHFTAINYFYKGSGEDEVYRLPPNNRENKLIKDTSGFKSYCRLIDIKKKGNKFSWKPLWEFPAEYMNYNWEGVAAYKKGYFIINDKYTPKRPYSSVLLYLQNDAER